MVSSVRDSIYEAILSIRLVDPHTHINPHDPGSHNLADILGYHYYTELIHSAGMSQSEIEEEGISSRELVRRLVTGLPNIENTANYQWLIDICQTFFDFEDEVITPDNWEALYDHSERMMNSAQWPEIVLEKSNVEAVFLTNDFDDDLQGFDSNTYIPCLRTDDLVFHLAKPETRERLSKCSGFEINGSLTSLRAALTQRFEHFVAAGARACAISIPPSFEPTMVPDGRASKALDHVVTRGLHSDPAHLDALSRRVFWTIAELSDHYGLPFDLMIGVNRQVYPKGVYQGQDLYDSRVSLIQYRNFFNAFPSMKFPISVLASVTNQELVSYSWIFPNVLTNGHWWYSNTPSFIYRDAAARLEAVPQNKQIAYYSDAYKLEFVAPKFAMYRRILADILAGHFVGNCGWSEERAIELGHRVLRGNVDEIFRSPLEASGDSDTWEAEINPTAPAISPSAPAISPSAPAISPSAPAISENTAGVAAAAAGLAASAIGAMEVAQPPLELQSVPELPSAPQETSDEIPSLDTQLSEPPAEIAPSNAETMDELAFADADPSAATVDESPDEYLGSAPEEINTLDESELMDASELSDFLASDSSADEDGVATVDDLSEKTVGPDFGTVVEVEETTPIEPPVQPPLMPIDGNQLDPLPTDEEIAEAKAADVELDVQPQKIYDADSLEAEIDPLPLNPAGMETIDELNPNASALDQSEIKMLTGESSFTPSDDELVLKPDPLTGELHFPAPDENDETGDEDFGAGLFELSDEDDEH